MKSVKIRSDFVSVTVANSCQDICRIDDMCIVQVNQVPDHISARQVANLFRVTLINTNRLIFSYKELGMNKIIM